MVRHVSTILLLILALNTLWFVLHAVELGWSGLQSPTPHLMSRVFATDTPVANWALAVHMIAGAALTLGAPLQALPQLRRYWPHIHRKTGYAMVTLALVTGFAGLVYILIRGTIGGWWMSLWFAIYGAATIWAAVKTVAHAIRGNVSAHFEWATRLVILAVGSWIYRMHYALWYALTDGAATNAAFTGLFDQIQVVAFFVPYLLIAEAMLRYRRRREPSHG